MRFDRDRDLRHPLFGKVRGPSETMKWPTNSYKKNGSNAVFNDSSFSSTQVCGKNLDLWSFDLFVFCFASAVVCRTFAVIGLFYFVTWLRHDFHLNYIN